MELTILTPAYNREAGVAALWKSLQNQTDHHFEWLIVDDGSTDNTRDLVKKLQPESDFPIRYIYKDNGGKHTALNVGINTIKSDLTFIVDSDDTLTPDAIEVVLRYHNKYKNDKTLCGYSFLRKFPDGSINGKKFSPDELKASYIDARINADDTMADKAEVFRSSCLREYPFPEYKGEKFLGEDIVWIRMARKYQMVHINKAIYIGQYLSDGLTSNRRRNNISSPIGCMNRAKEYLESDIKMKYRLKGALQYIVYGKFSGEKVSELIDMSNHKILVTICVPFGIMLYNKWKQTIR